MFEVDFLPVESEQGQGSKSGDAIAVHFTSPVDGRHRVVVIDGGYAAVGDDMAEHIDTYYHTRHVDLMISTHMDADHLNGLVKIIESCTVDELWVHLPRLHRSDLTNLSNLEALDNLIAIARENGVRIVEPFTGQTAFDGQIRVLGPTEPFYEDLLDETLQTPIEAKSALALRAERMSAFIAAARGAVDKVLDHLPIETLTDEGETSPRNNMSVITLMQLDGQRLLFTGDAGMPALEQAADEYERLYGSFGLAPLDFIQIPHHGSKRNVGPTILNRILGDKGSGYNNAIAFVSAAKASTKHPSPKVTNAFARRGCVIGATEGDPICYHLDGPDRGWAPLTPVPPLAEDDDE